MMSGGEPSTTSWMASRRSSFASSSASFSSDRRPSRRALSESLMKVRTSWTGSRSAAAAGAPWALGAAGVAVISIDPFLVSHRTGAPPFCAAPLMPDLCAAHRRLTRPVCCLFRRLRMKYRDFGATGLRVSEIGIGAFPIAGLQTRPDGMQTGWTGIEDRESVALIHRAEELGVNVIDSAEGYGAGHSESIVGEALQGGRRQKWVVATKVQPNQGLDREKADTAAVRKRILDACAASLRRLRMETIDLYQLHAIPHEWASETVMAALAQLKREGKVRFYGISTNNQA